MNKRNEIIKRIISHPLENWEILHEIGKYDRYITTINNIKIWLWRRHEQAPNIEINNIEFYNNDLIKPFLRQLDNFEKNRKESVEDNEINELFSKLIS